MYNKCLCLVLKIKKDAFPADSEDEPLSSTEPFIVHVADHSKQYTHSKPEIEYQSICYMQKPKTKVTKTNLA